MTDALDLDAKQKPAISRADYDRARAVLDVLPAGYYAKCGTCLGWFTGGRYRQSPSGPVCEGCHENRLAAKVSRNEEVHNSG